MNKIYEEDASRAEQIRIGQSQRSGETRMGHSGKHFSYKTQKEKDYDEAKRYAIKDNNWALYNDLKAKDLQQRQEREAKLKQERDINKAKGRLSLEECQELIPKINNLMKELRKNFRMPIIRVHGGFKDKYYVILLKCDNLYNWDMVNNNIQELFKNEIFNNGKGVKTYQYQPNTVNRMYGIVIPIYKSLQESIQKIVRRILKEMYKR